MAIGPWINWNTSLFWHPSSSVNPLYQLSVEIIRVKWLREEDAILTLRGILPSAMDFLKGFKENDVLFVYHKEHGIREEMEDGEVIMIFSVSEVLRKWIDYPVVIHPEDDHLITFYIRAKCKFSL